MEVNSSCLHLKSFERAHITKEYLSWLNDPLVTRFSNQRFLIHTEESSAAYLSSFERTVNSFLLITRRSDGKPIGTTTVFRNKHHGRADIGLMLGDRESWGRGYGYEAWQAVLTALMAEDGIRKVSGGTARPNKAMVAIMEKCQMKLEAIRERHEVIDGKPVDLLYFAKFTA